VLDDCEEGSTLRTYLTRKLNCSPMRISKKFSHQCIGRHVFIRRQQYHTRLPYCVPFLSPIQVPSQLNFFDESITSSRNDSTFSPCSLSPSSTYDDSASMMSPEVENHVWKEVLLFYCGESFIGATTPGNNNET
jgi:hypothetical protein